MTVNSQGKAAPLATDHPQHWYWRARLIHLLEEFSLRPGSYPNGIDDELASDIKFPDPRSTRINRASLAVDRQALARGSYLVKYGQKEHLAEMLHKGLVRIAPASSYAAFEENDAIMDTELKFTFSLYNPSLKLIGEHITLPADATVNKRFLGTAHLDQTLREDYYLFCLSASYDPRLFDDFQANACMIIGSPHEFRARLMQRVAAKVDSAGWGFAPVTYVDPFSIPNSKLRAALRKHHRFAYQDEVRAAWLMRKGSGKDLDAKFVEIGSLSDIAQVICIEAN